MPVTVVIGAQWGDEGKGKVVDLLAAEADVVARYQGGANAGHTIAWGEGADRRQYVLHLVPSGIFHAHATCVIGGGVVLDPVALFEELAVIEGAGFATEGRLRISHNAHVIMPYHKRLDAVRERGAGEGAIGTTGRGIGPAYTDKYGRTGIRVVDLLDRDVLSKKIRAQVEEKNTILRALYDHDPLDVEAIVEEYVEFDRRLDPYVTDTAVYLNEQLKAGRRVLAEGAQGALLDVDFGTYPYVTSSNPTVGGALTGLGIPPTAIDRVIGIVKAYCTRVGNGPFVTELTDATGERLRKVGHEFGATTGRPRRCGWLDLVALRYSAMINGLTELAVTKLDVLSGAGSLQVATHYRVGDRETGRFPSEAETLERATPVYERHDGWDEDLGTADHFDALPGAARRYLRHVEAAVDVPIRLVSAGPRREETITV